jgi:thioredoxin reductase
MSAYDVVVVGGGPAGLQAALLMARGRTRVLVCDSGTARHLASDASHSFLGADGMAPAELRRRGRMQLDPYDTVEFRDGLVDGLDRLSEGGFRVSVRGERGVTTRFVLLATGVRDVPLDLPGYDELWGTTLLHCPYCHGWEFRDRKLGALVLDEEAVGLAKKVTWWSNDVTFFVCPDVSLSEELSRELSSCGAAIETRRVRRFVGDLKEGRLEAVELEDGTTVPRDAVYYRPQQRQCPLVEELSSSLDLELDPEGFVKVDDQQQTSVSGLYAAGDLTTAYQQIVEAAGQGHRAASAIEGALKATCRPVRIAPDSRS